MQQDKVTDQRRLSTKRADTYFFQYLVAFSVCILSFGDSVAFAWTSPALPLLMDANKSPIPITSSEGSWIVSIHAVGTILVTIPAAFLMETIGRKKTLLIAAIPLIIGWILTGVAESISVLYVARLMCGFAHGLTYTVLPIYLTEIASDKIRGSIAITLTLMSKVGVLCSYVIGSYTGFRTMAWIGLALPITFLVCFIWLPDSPYYLIGKNRDTQAITNLVRLRGHNDVQSEYEMMNVAVRKSEENKGTTREIFSRDNRRAVIIILGLGAAQHLCGARAVTSYAQIIFDKVGSGLGGAESTFVLAAVQLVTAALSSVIVDRIGRRPLLLFSVLAPAICNTIVGVYFFLDFEGNDVTSLAWLPMTAIMIFIFAYSVGLASITFVILGEVFPKNLKAAASAISAIFSSGLTFGVAKLFQIVTDDLGIHTTFWIFAGFSYLSVPFIWFVIPETKGKSLDAILEELRPARIIKNLYL